MSVHTGKSPASLPDDMNPNDEAPFWVSWEAPLNGYTMISSQWVLPQGFTIGATLMDVTSDPDEDGNTYPNSNGAIISTTQTEGTYYIGNQITYNHTAFGEVVTLQRGFNVTIDNV